MNLSIGPDLENLIETAVTSGRFPSPDAMVTEGLRLVEARETRLNTLRATLAAAIAEANPTDDTGLDAELASKAAELAKAGF